MFEAMDRSVRGFGDWGLPRLAFVGIVLLFTGIGDEYPADGPALWYQKQVLGIPLHYLVFAFAVALLLPYVTARPPFRVLPALRATHLGLWTLLTWVTVIIALGRGLVGAVSEPFVDWRNFVVLAITAMITARWLAQQPWRGLVVTDLAIAYGVVATFYLVFWLFGGGRELYDVRVPLFNGHRLALVGFGTLVGADAWLAGRQSFTRIYSAALGWTAVAGALLILLSFRRSVWGFLVAGLVVAAYRAVRMKRLRLSRAMTVGVGLVAVIGALSLTYGAESWSGRIESLLPSADNEYSNTNRDHFNDLRDAFAAVAEQPVFGVGIGTLYKTNLISDWKVESFDVHNAFLHVWLKFGLLGLITFVGFHVALIRSLFKLDRVATVGAGGAAAFLLAEQVINLIQTWPYAVMQLTIHRGVVLAVLLVHYGYLADPTALATTSRRAALISRR